MSQRWPALCWLGTKPSMGSPWPAMVSDDVSPRVRYYVSQKLISVEKGQYCAHLIVCAQTAIIMIAWETFIMKVMKHSKLLLQSTVVWEKKGTFICELTLERYIYLRNTQKQLKITNGKLNNLFRRDDDHGAIKSTAVNPFLTYWLVDSCSYMKDYNLVPDTSQFSLQWSKSWSSL